MSDHDFAPTPEDYAVPLAEHLADLDALGPFASNHTAASHEAALRRALAAEAEGDRLRQVLRGILGMAEADNRLCRDGSLPQIEADARAALEGKGD